MKKVITISAIAVCALIWTYAVYFSQLNLANTQVWVSSALNIPGLYVKGVEAMYSRFVVMNSVIHGGPAFY